MVDEIVSSHTQYGCTLFIDDFKGGSSAKTLTRISYTAKATAEAPYDEAWLQRLIMERPNLLPFHEIEPAFANVVPVCTELATRSGYHLDNLLVTPAGDLALVECKLWRNPEARRQVIGQIIEYAKELSTWGYKELEHAISRARRFGRPDARSKQNLYETVSVNGEIDEASFHDAVSRNLRRGRFLLLIVGDGIREEFESMAEFLQQHAGLHFTLALVELALFEVPKGGYIAQPRVLARTTNIDRGIVTVDKDGRISVKPSTVAPIQGGHPVKMTITKELYLEKLERQFPGISERLNGFIDKLVTYDVRPEFGTDSMILRWRPDDTRTWNIALISTAGQVFTDNLGTQAYAAGLLEVQERYVKRLAALVPGAAAKLSKKQTTWNAYKDDRTITVDALLADEVHEEGWLDAIAEFQRTVMKRLQVEPAEPNARGNPAMLREVVLEVGAEGGSMKLVRERNPNEDWRFRIETDETALSDMLSEDDRDGIEFSSQTAYVHTFEEALTLLDKYPWFKLSALEVHPEFVDAVLRGVGKRGGQVAESRWREKLNNQR